MRRLGRSALLHSRRRRPSLLDFPIQLARSRLVVAQVEGIGGETPRRQRVLGALKRLEKKLQMREWSFHSLRHYFCTTLIRRGASIEAVRLLAGHSKLDVTQR